MSGNEFACSLGSSSAKIVWVWKKLVEKRWRITHADIRPGVYGPLVFGSFNCNDFGSHLTKPTNLNKLEYFIRPIKNIYFFVNCWPSGSMLIYCICPQYLLGAPFALITASIRGHEGDQFVALLSCMEAQVSLTVAFSSSAFFGLLFLIFPSLDSLWG